MRIHEYHDQFITVLGDASDATFCDFNEGNLENNESPHKNSYDCVDEKFPIKLLHTLFLVLLIPLLAHKRPFSIKHTGMLYLPESTHCVERFSGVVDTYQHVMSWEPKWHENNQLRKWTLTLLFQPA